MPTSAEARAARARSCRRSSICQTSATTTRLTICGRKNSARMTAVEAHPSLHQQGEAEPGDIERGHQHRRHRVSVTSQALPEQRVAPHAPIVGEADEAVAAEAADVEEAEASASIIGTPTKDEEPERVRQDEQIAGDPFAAAIGQPRSRGSVRRHDPLDRARCEFRTAPIAASEDRRALYSRRGMRRAARTPPLPPAAVLRRSSWLAWIASEIDLVDLRRHARLGPGAGIDLVRRRSP